MWHFFVILPLPVSGVEKRDRLLSVVIVDDNITVFWRFL